MAVIGKVLSVASECVPLLKTGGLADVVGALPQALAGQGWEMRVMMPAYRALRGRIADWPVLWSDPDLFGGAAELRSGEVEGLSVLLLEAPHLYDRAGGPYGGPGGDWPDNPERFAALSWAAAEVARSGLADGWVPDILHAHDWQAGYAPAYLAFSGGGRRSVLTVHNIAFQGWADRGRLAGLRLPEWEFHSASLEYHGGLSALKAGLVTAGAITTVSPNYARELTRAEFGMGLQGVIAERAGDLHGILNGVDEGIWTPERADPPYSARNPRGKVQARAALSAEFGLEVPGPLAIVVSRLTDQKGIDLIPVAARDFLAAGGGLAILGSGDPVLEGAMQALADVHPGRVALRIGYDEGLSLRMFAGGDCVLVPSRFEPCGLTQMYGLRFGTLPVVSMVGGLADTVIPATPASLAAGVATGFAFQPTDAAALADALRGVVHLHRQPKVWAQMMRNAMRQDVGWARSAAAYADLYASLMV